MTLVDWIKQHEGLRLKPYYCPAGKLTIGWGKNIEDNGITIEEADYLLNNDIKRCVEQLSHYEWYTKQPQKIRDALINMCFNMGINRLLGFKKMIDALSRRDYTQAAIEALDSKWAQQVPNRAKDVAVMIREGYNAPRC